MARSKHTRPRVIIASDRIRSPREKRGTDDKSNRQVLRRILKGMGIVETGKQTGPSGEKGRGKGEAALEEEKSSPPALPKIRVQKPRIGFFHPADRAQVRAVLLHFGELSLYGVKEIRLAQNHQSARTNKLHFGHLRMPGVVILYEQAPSPWLISGTPDDTFAVRLKRAGAVVEYSANSGRCKIDWPGDSLRNFMLFDVLMHEIGHHILQQFKGKRTVPSARRKDHEELADSFARRCREDYLECQPE